VVGVHRDSPDNPFQTSCFLTFIDYGNNIFSGQCDLLKVPKGKRAVIEHVSMSASLSPVVSITGVALYTSLKGQHDGEYHDFVPTLLGAANSSYNWVASSPVRLYSNEKTTINFALGIYGLNAGAGASGRVTISGYYTPLTTP
jgi:hypothetical protein